MTIRILHLINTGEVGGGGEHLLQLTQGLRPLGVDSSVAVGRDGPAAGRLRDAGVPVVVLGPLGLTAPARIAALARSAQHDVLHAHGSRSGMAAALAARLERLAPIVYTAHALSFRRLDQPRLVRWALARGESLACRSAARVIYLTRADLLAAQRAGVATPHAVVIPNGIDPTRFPASQDCRRELGLSPDVPVAGFIARLVPQKDPLRFVWVAAAVSRLEPAARFLLVGEGPLRSAVEDAVRRAELGSRLILAGVRWDIPEMLATMDVLVLTSRWEGLPIAVLEAMAAGRPVVTPALEGIDEVVEDGRTGIVVRGDDDALAAAVARLLRHPELRRELGAAARTRSETRFSAAAMAGATADVYAAVLAAPQGPRAQSGD